MGMDVFGKKPTDPVGEYFRSNIWYWHPLWTYVESVEPDICSKVQYPHSNDGSGLGAKDSRLLSQSILQEIQSGKAEQYIEQYEQSINAIPLEDCSYCDDTGLRTWTENNVEVQKTCNACNGSLKVKPFAAHYYMNIDHIKEFQIFLYHCGGFEIW